MHRLPNIRSLVRSSDGYGGTPKYTTYETTAECSVQHAQLGGVYYWVPYWEVRSLRMHVCMDVCIYVRICAHVFVHSHTLV